MKSSKEPATPAGHVKPLGLFGMLGGEPELAQLRASLEARRGEIADAERPAIAAYLRGGAIVFAIMEWTNDVLEGAFDLAGGSAVLTDGRYYWRRDSAEYVERYGIGLPDEFLQLGRSAEWSVPTVDRDALLRIDAFLMEHGRRIGGPGPATKTDSGSPTDRGDR